MRVKAVLTGPSRAPLSIANCCAVDTVTTRERAIALSRSTNGDNVSNGQFSPSVSFPMRHSASPLLIHIGNVLTLRAFKEMCRITAGWIVATMQYIKARGPKSKAMCPHHLACDFEPAIASGCSCSRPRPTSIWPASLVYMRPKAFFGRPPARMPGAWLHLIQMLRAAGRVMESPARRPQLPRYRYTTDLAGFAAQKLWHGAIVAPLKVCVDD